MWMLFKSCALVLAVTATVQAPIRIRVTDLPRPVSAAVRQVERAFGFVVTYEDTSYVHPDDIVDITARVRRDGDLSKKILGMRNGSIDVQYVPRAPSMAANVEAVLLDVVRASRQAGNTGDFRVACLEDACHVTPIAIRGASGQREAYAPLLDTRIALEPGTVNGAEFVQRIADALAHASGRDVRPGMIPINLMLQRKLSIDRRRGSAREVLWRGLRALSPRLSWQLLCGAGEGAACALNVHLVNVR